MDVHNKNLVYEYLIMTGKLVELSCFKMGKLETTKLLVLSITIDGVDETVREGIEDIVKSGIDETVEVDATVKFGIEETVTVEDSSAIAVPELLDDSDELLTALLQTERTTAKVHTKTSCQRRFFQDSDMIDPLIDVNKPPLVPLRFRRGCIAEWCQNACGASVSGLQQVGFPDQADR